MLLKKLAIFLIAFVMVAAFAMIQGCSDSENPVEALAESQVDNSQQRVSLLEADISEDSLVQELSLFNINDRYEVLNNEKNQSNPVVASSWWSRLNQSQKNYQIIIESLYSVDRNIWGQNSRIPCDFWGSYVWGGCSLMGNWAYSYRFPGRVGYGGTCKDFANELVRRASGWATSLPPGSNFIGIFPYRNKADAIVHAQAGEILQFTGSGLHTAVIISNFHDGRFEVVDANWSWPDYDYKIRKHVIDTYKSGSIWTSATLRSYVIDH